LSCPLRWLSVFVFVYISPLAIPANFLPNLSSVLWSSRNRTINVSINKHIYICVYIYICMYVLHSKACDCKYTSHQLHEQHCHLHLQLFFLLFSISCVFILQRLIRSKWRCALVCNFNIYNNIILTKCRWKNVFTIL